MTLGGQEVDYLWPLVLASGCNTRRSPAPRVLVLQQLSVHCLTTCRLCRSGTHTPTSSGLPVILSAQLPISYSANNVNVPGEAAFPSQSTGKNQEAASVVSKDEPKTCDPREIYVTQASSVGLHPRTQMGKVGDSLITGFVQKVRESPQESPGAGCDGSTAESVADGHWEPEPR